VRTGQHRCFGAVGMFVAMPSRTDVSSRGWGAGVVVDGGRDARQHLENFVAMRCRGEEPALEKAAPALGQTVPLVRLFHAFGDARQLETVAQSENCRCQVCRSGIDVDAGNEAAVDLDAVDGQFEEVSEAGITGSEVVDRHMGARAPQLVHV